MDIFISYSRSDRDRVTHIARGLEQAGYSVWWDRHIKPGQDFGQVIEDAINQAKAVVVVWSNASVRSNWVRDEAQFGVQHDRLVPVMIDPVNTPLGFGRIHAAELFDGADDPTQSSQWADFLESVRVQIGEGSGNGESAGEVSVQSLSGASATASPSGTAAGAAATPLWKRPLTMAAAVLGLIVAGLLLMQFDPLGMGGEDSRLAGIPADKPVVLGIYPSDKFGPRQQNGLKEALGGNEQFTFHGLSATVDDMKARKAEDVIEELELFLKNRNVVAIVGPSITEFTPQVLAAVEGSGSQPAIVLLTAGSREDLGWEGSSLPIFRVGSGQDERAMQFSGLASSSIAGGLGIVFMVETPEEGAAKTYGQFFYDRIAANMTSLEDWRRSGQVEVIEYTRGEITKEFASEERQALLDQRKIIIVLGLSSDLEDLAAAYFRSDQPQRTAILGGWNTSYGLLKRSNDNSIALQYDRLLDMTDVFMRDGAGDAPSYVRDFEMTFEGEVSPLLRMEAVAYDSGLVVQQAASKISGDLTAERLVGQLRSGRFEGVTGRIYFDGNTGQNTGHAGGLRPLYNLTYNPQSKVWRRVESIDAMFARQLAGL